jgi:hypothetical protein
MKIFSNPPEKADQISTTLLEVINIAEKIGKTGTIILGIFYALGIIVFGAYYSNLHVRLRIPVMSISESG